jgi:hypothetical protein
VIAGRDKAALGQQRRDHVQYLSAQYVAASGQGALVNAADVGHLSAILAAEGDDVALAAPAHRFQRRDVDAHSALDSIAVGMFALVVGEKAVVARRGARGEQWVYMRWKRIECLRVGRVFQRKPVFRDPGEPVKARPPPLVPRAARWPDSARACLPPTRH